MNKVLSIYLSVYLSIHLSIITQLSVLPKVLTSLIFMRTSFAKRPVEFGVEHSLRREGHISGA